MSARKKSPIPADKIESYEKLLATIPQIERRGADYPYISVNGNMFRRSAAFAAIYSPG